jgi:hypothetical protein
VGAWQVQEVGRLRESDQARENFGGNRRSQRGTGFDDARDVGEILLPFDSMAATGRHGPPRRSEYKSLVLPFTFQHVCSSWRVRLKPDTTYENTFPPDLSVLPDLPPMAFPPVLPGLGDSDCRRSSTHESGAGYIRSGFQEPAGLGPP